MIRSAIAMLGGRRFEEWQLAPAANNFNLVRLLLASFVIWSHSLWLLAGGAERDQISDLVGHTIAYLAVDGFFFVSGFLVSQSLFRQHDAWRFAAMRVGRIWPGLVVSLLATVLAFALASGRPLAYLVESETLRFLGQNLVQLKGHYLLPALDPGGEPMVVNGSLWTITWELRCYVALGLFYLFAAHLRPRALAVVTFASVIACAVWAVARELSPVFPDVSHGLGYHLGVWMRMWGCFAAGIAAAVWRRHLVIIPAVAVLLWLAAVAEHQVFATSLLAAPAMFYSVLVAAFGQRARRAATASWHDLSYGVYIYAFPVMVLVDLALPDLSHAQLALANLAATLPIAALSWLLVEKPALAATKRVMRRGTMPTAREVAPAE